MNKRELVIRVAAACDLSEAATEVALQAVLDVIAEAMAEGERISLPNFGVFECRRRQLPQGFLRNLPAPSGDGSFRAPTFKPATALRRKMKGSVPENAS